MSGLDFLDTNILVYAYDSSTPEKQKIAQSILTQAVNNENAFVSTQVLGEFFTVITHKVKNSIGKDEALDIINMQKVLDIILGQPYYQRSGKSRVQTSSVRGFE